MDAPEVIAVPGWLVGVIGTMLTTAAALVGLSYRRGGAEQKLASKVDGHADRLEDLEARADSAEQRFQDMERRFSLKTEVEKIEQRIVSEVGDVKRKQEATDKKIDESFTSLTRRIDERFDRLGERPAR